MKTFNPFYSIVESAIWVERLLPLGGKAIQLRMKEQPRALACQHADIMPHLDLCLRDKQWLQATKELVFVSL